MRDWEEKDFLQEYIQQIASHGYLDAPFELQAEAKATRACRDAGVHPFWTFPLILSKEARPPGPCADLALATRAHSQAAGSVAVSSEKPTASKRCCVETIIDVLVDLPSPALKAAPIDFVAYGMTIKQY
jgi:hypothetical protein